jgi:hypothetical protein
MYLMLSSLDGTTVEGLLLAVNRNQMRVAVPGQADALEFRLVGDQWTSEDGQRIELDFLSSTAADATALQFPKAFAAPVSHLW